MADSLLEALGPKTAEEENEKTRLQRAVSAFDAAKAGDVGLAETLRRVPSRDENGNVPDWDKWAESKTGQPIEPIEVRADRNSDEGSYSAGFGDSQYAELADVVEKKAPVAAPQVYRGPGGGASVAKAAGAPSSYGLDEAAVADYRKRLAEVPVDMPADWKKVFSDKQKELDERLAGIQSSREDVKSNMAWGEVAERLGNALVMLGAGYTGAKTGRDIVSGTHFDKTDWNRKWDQNMKEFDRQVMQVEKDKAGVAASEAGSRKSWDAFVKDNRKFITDEFKSQQNFHRAMAVQELRNQGIIQAAHIRAAASAAKGAGKVDKEAIKDRRIEEKIEQEARDAIAKNLENESTALKKGAAYFEEIATSPNLTVAEKQERLNAATAAMAAAPQSTQAIRHAEEKPATWRILSPSTWTKEHLAKPADYAGGAAMLQKFAKENDKKSTALRRGDDIDKVMGLGEKDYGANASKDESSMVEVRAPDGRTKIVPREAARAAGLIK